MTGAAIMEYFQFNNCNCNVHQNALDRKTRQISEYLIAFQCYYVLYSLSIVIFCGITFPFYKCQGVFSCANAKILN